LWKLGADRLFLGDRRTKGDLTCMVTTHKADTDRRTSVIARNFAKHGGWVVATQTVNEKVDGPVMPIADSDTP